MESGSPTLRDGLLDLKRNYALLILTTPYSRTAAELESTERAVDAYRQAVLKDVNSVIVQRTPGDIALPPRRPGPVAPAVQDV